MNRSKRSDFFLLALPILGVLFGLSGCKNTDETRVKEMPLKKTTVNNTVKANNESFNSELAQALLAKDFRLYATSGRRITFPGIPNEKIAFITEYCGKKFMANTGDVIYSVEQKKQRKYAVEYMKKYNQAMVVSCEKNTLREAQGKRSF